MIILSQQPKISTAHTYSTSTPTAQHKVPSLADAVLGDQSRHGCVPIINHSLTPLVANPRPSSFLRPCLTPPLGKGRHLSRSQSLRSVDSRKRDEVDKPRSGQQSSQTGKTTGRRGNPCISHCGSLGDHHTCPEHTDNHTLKSCTLLHDCAHLSKSPQSSAMSIVDYSNMNPDWT